MEDINTEQPTFNGMNRAAMILGAPIMPLVVSAFILVMLSLILVSLIGAKAFLLVSFIVPIFLGLRTISLNDDQAFKIYADEAKWLMRKNNAHLFGNTLTILNTKYGRQQSDYQRFLEQGAQKPASSGGFSAQNLPTRYS